MPGTSKTPPRLHSGYNPQAEAARYLAHAVSLAAPECIVVTEPGESHLAGAIRRKFPGAKIYAIRYQDDFFLDSDPLWDSCWRPASGISPEAFLFRHIPDESLPQTVFLPWKPAETFWPQAAERVWQAIASVIRVQQSVMQTRAVFGRRWLKNTVHNLAAAENIIRCPEIRRAPLLVASGPQLERFPASFYQNLHTRFFLCGLSSASAFLHARRVVPDIFLSTDGGYWAGRLFQTIPAPVPVLFPPEACIPDTVLERNPCVFLTYGSECENTLFPLCGILPENGERNGTVSGTAVMFFLKHTAFPVYSIGLDLQPGSGYPHGRPHPFSPETNGRAFRFHPLESQVVQSKLNSALDIYRSWFARLPQALSGRLFRLESSAGELGQLGGIRSLPVRQPDGSFHNLPEPRTLPAAAVNPETKTGNGSRHSPLCKAERRKAIRSWLFETAEKTARSGRELQAVSARDNIETEIVKLYGYAEYISLRKSAAEGKNGTAASAEELCAKAAGFLRELGEQLH